MTFYCCTLLNVEQSWSHLLWFSLPVFSIRGSNICQPSPATLYLSFNYFLWDWIFRTLWSIQVQVLFFTHLSPLLLLLTNLKQSFQKSDPLPSPVLPDLSAGTLSRVGLPTAVLICSCGAQKCSLFSFKTVPAHHYVRLKSSCLPADKSTVWGRFTMLKAKCLWRLEIDLSLKSSLLKLPVFFQFK